LNLKPFIAKYEKVAICPYDHIDERFCELKTLNENYFLVIHKYIFLVIFITISPAKGSNLLKSKTKIDIEI